MECGGVSGGTRSVDGRDCRDAFLGLMRTAAKLGIAFWDYLGDRLRIPGQPNVPYLPASSAVVDSQPEQNCPLYREPRDSSDQRCYPHPMGRRRAKSPFEDNPVIDGFLEWMDAPEGQQSIEALDLVFDALEHAGVDARQRKIVWADGKRLSIEQSAERIHAGHQDVACDVIETHVLGWLESCTPEAYSERQLEELDRLIEPWRLGRAFLPDCT